MLFQVVHENVCIILGTGGVSCSICPHLTTFFSTCSISCQFFLHPHHYPTSTMVSQKDAGGTVIYNLLSLNPQNVDHRWQLRSRTTFSILSHTSGLEPTHTYTIYSTLSFLTLYTSFTGVLMSFSTYSLTLMYSTHVFPGLHGPLWDVAAITPYFLFYSLNFCFVTHA